MSQAEILQNLSASQDPIDAPDFDPISYINSQFPNEQSLSGIDALQDRLSEEIATVSSEISLLIREQSTVRAKAKVHLQASHKNIRTLQQKISTIREKSQTSQNMVQQICQDIQVLDIAKKNLTKIITALKKQAMLTNAVKQLPTLCENKQYVMAGALLNASSDLLLFFKDCMQIPSLQALKQERDKIMSSLRLQILQDLRELENTPPEMISEACSIVDQLGEKLRGQVCGIISNHFLRSYNDLFRPGQMHSGFEFIDRRIAWLKRTLRQYQQEYSRFFPEQWNLPALISREFCEFTKVHVIEILQRGQDSSSIVNALQKTIQFQNEITKRFQLSRIDQRRKPEISLKEMIGDYEENMQFASEKRSITPTPKFKGVISICFNPYLSHFCQSEQINLKQSIDMFISEDTTTENTVFPSSIRLFTAIKQKFTKCLSFSTGSTLYELTQVFRRSLVYYSEKLASRLPRVDKQVKLGEGEEVFLSFIVNTAEYCRSTLTEMETTIRAKLEIQYDFQLYQQQNQFMELAGKSIQTLVLGVLTKMDPHFGQMTKINWLQEEVGDKSEYISKIAQIIVNTCRNISNVINQDYRITFLTKLTQNVNQKFIQSLYKCKRIGSFGAQQLLLDCYEVKTRFLQLDKSSAFVSIVQRLFQKTENILKVLSSPHQRAQENYTELIKDANQAEFEKILGLMGAKKETPWKFLQK